MALGHNPQVALDSRNWAHVLYEADGQIWHAAHLYDLYWQIEAVGPGHTPQAITFHDDPATPDVDEGGFALSYLEGSTLHLRAYGLTPLLLPGWTAVAALPLTDLPTGAVQLDSVRDPDGNRLLAAAWVSYTPAPPIPPAPEPPLTHPPIHWRQRPFPPHHLTPHWYIFPETTCAMAHHDE